MHRREALISAALPRSRHVPRLLDSYDDGDWVGLAFEAIAGRPPRHPWDPLELEAVAGGLSSHARRADPQPGAVAGAARRVRAPDVFGGWADLASTASAPASLDGWARQHLTALADVEAGWPEACAGATLVHGDVRSDNVLLGVDGVVFVDWPHGAVGNPAFDVVAWAPSVVLEGGPDPEVLLTAYARLHAGRPRRHHDPPGCDLRFLRVAVAPAAATRAPDAPRVPGCPGRGGPGLAPTPYPLALTFGAVGGRRR